MRQAILSDLHSNLEAAQACVTHARSQGATHFACLGDCIGYGADPVLTLDLLCSLPHLLMIRGNHDEAMFRDVGFGKAGLRAALDWTSAQPTPAHRALPEAAPYVQTLGNATYAHASAHGPQTWEYLREPEQIRACLAATPSQVAFIGHVHVPMVHYLTAGDSLHEHDPEPGMPIPLSSTCRYVVNVVSVGQPRDGNNAAAYALYDSDRAEATLHRVPYDYLGAAGKILAAGLSSGFAERLKEGR